MDLILMGGLAAAVAYCFASLRVVKEYERGVAFFLGRCIGSKGPGLIFLPAFFANQRKVSLRIAALDIPPQDVITRDNVSVKVNAVLYMQVRDPVKAILQIEDYRYATSQLAQTTLRSVLGEVELDELLADRDKINAVLKRIIDERSEPWGIEVSAVEVKDVDLPDQMKRAIAKQAEAERERRAKVINAQGELQASQTMAEAARTLATEPMSLQLRYLQTVVEIAAENNSTTLFPLPMELFRPFMPQVSAPGLPSAPSIPMPAAPAPMPTMPPPPTMLAAAAFVPNAIPAATPAGDALPSEGEGAPIPSAQLQSLMEQLRVQAAQRFAEEAKRNG